MLFRHFYKGRQLLCIYLLLFASLDNETLLLFTKRNTPCVYVCGISFVCVCGWGIGRRRVGGGKGQVTPMKGTAQSCEQLCTRITCTSDQTVCLRTGKTDQTLKMRWLICVFSSFSYGQVLSSYIYYSE